MLFEIRVFTLNGESYTPYQVWGDRMEDSRELEKLFRDWLEENNYSASWLLKSFRV